MWDLVCYLTILVDQQSKVLFDDHETQLFVLTCHVTSTSNIIETCMFMWDSNYLG